MTTNEVQPRIVDDRRASTGGAGPSRFQPGTFALRDTWFPIFSSAMVHRRPVRRAIHGEPVIAYRKDHKVHVADHMPGFSAQARRQSEFTGGSGRYPVVERFGYIWVWYGDPEHASEELVPNVPHMPLAGQPRHFIVENVYDICYELAVENLLDLTHADFLHTSLTGDSLAEDDQIEVFSTSETITMVRTAMGRKIPPMQKLFAGSAKRQDVRITTMAHVRSGVCFTHGDFNPGMSIRQLAPNNPEMPNRTRQPLTFDAAHVPALVRHSFAAVAGHMVARQDNWAFREQLAQYVEPRENNDLSSRFDTAGLRYRKVFQRLVERQAAGDLSYLADGDPGRDVRSAMGLDKRVGSV